MNAKFQIGDILPIALTLVVAGIGIAYGLSVTGSVKEDMCASGYTYDGMRGTCSSCPSAQPTYNATSGVCYNATGTIARVPQETTEFNATGSVISGVSTISSNFSLIATIVVAAILIGILVRYLVFNNT
jgi:hypothetical protein